MPNSASDEMLNNTTYDDPPENLQRISLVGQQPDSTNKDCNFEQFATRSNEQHSKDACSTEMPNSFSDERLNNQLMTILWKIFRRSA